MNFTDVYEVPGGANNTTLTTQPEQSLNEEINQVVGQLGSWWGGFRKQSETVLHSARKDFDNVVAQAQKEFTKLTADAPAATSESESRVPQSGDVGEGNSTGQSTEAEAAASTSGTPTQESVSSPGSTFQSMFSRLQSSIPPNVISTVQSNIPESLKTADLAQIRSTLSSEFQRVQGVTLTQAEEYMHKSEVILKDVMKEAGDVLRDAVKVVPPEEADTNPGLMWDGTDIWHLASPLMGGGSDAKGKGKGKARDGRQRAVATRAEALLKQLKHDPSIISVDPEVTESVRETYAFWLKDEVETLESGTSGAQWAQKVEEALADDTDGAALKTTQDSLVPSVLTHEVFWRRYFFRVHQIEQEEERRKTLIQQSDEADEVFAWEDDDEEPGAAKSPGLSPTAKDSQSLATSSSSQKTLQKGADSSAESDKRSAPSSRAHTPSNVSPRDSSEGSYDWVSSTADSTPGEEKKEPRKTNTEDDDADSDWE